jgi:hypothetical protein
MKYEKSDMGPRITELNKMKGPELLQPYTILASASHSIVTVVGLKFSVSNTSENCSFFLFMSHSFCVPLKEGRPAVSGD